MQQGVTKLELFNVIHGSGFSQLTVITSDEVGGSPTQSGGAALSPENSAPCSWFLRAAPPAAGFSTLTERRVPLFLFFYVVLFYLTLFLLFYLLKCLSIF